MKKFLSAFAVVLFAAFTLTSCGNNDVEKVATILNETAEKLNGLEQGDFEGFQAIGQEMQTQLDQYKESTQELTEADYKTLAQGILNVSMASYKVAYDMPELSAEEQTEAINTMVPEFAKYKTLGEFISQQ